jgi:antitoxin YefM
VLDVNLAEDVYPISEAQDSLRRLVQKASETQRPMVITQKGRPVAALIEIGEFERLRRLADLADDYREIIAGQDSPSLSHGDVWTEISARLGGAAPATNGD